MGSGTTKGREGGGEDLEFANMVRLLFVQVFGDGGELFQGGFEVVGDFLGGNFGGGQIGGFFQRIVFQPQDVQEESINELVNQ
jgi:hypothetical protein